MSNAALAEGMEVAKKLVQRVCRSFYETRQSIVLDQLMRTEAMRDDELAGRVGLTIRDVTKIAQVLVNDQIVAVHRRQEHAEGAFKAMQRTYYYMDYSHAIDVVKWRMYKIQSVIDDKLRNELDSQGYVCPRCKAAFTTLDASFLLDPYRGCFVCDQPGCGTELKDNEDAEEVKGSKDRMARLIDQTRVIRDLLKRMDDVVLPRFDVVKWLELNGPAGTLEPVIPIASGSQVRIELAGDDDAAILKAQREADIEAKRTQNQLPSWIAQSTVNGDSTSSQLDSIAAAERAAKASKDFKPMLPSTTSSGDVEASDFDSYYASLEAAEEEQTLDTPGLASVTPASSSTTTTPKVEQTDGEEDFSSNGNGKRSRDELDSEPDAQSIELLKKPKLEDVDEAEIIPMMEDDEDEDDFEEVGDEDPNPMLSVAGKLMPFEDIKASDELTGAMTPDEYIIFWDVYQRIG